MSGAVERITEHVRWHLHRLRQKGGRPSRRVLLALDGCTQHVVVGQERVFLKDLLSRLFGALKAVGVRLTAAVTMRATGPMAPGRVGVLGEKTVVVEALDARRCVRGATPVLCVCVCVLRCFACCLVFGHKSVLQKNDCIDAHPSSVWLFFAWLAL